VCVRVCAFAYVRVATLIVMKLHGETVWNELHMQARQDKIRALRGGHI
jgi:hypothetical protein